MQYELRQTWLIEQIKNARSGAIPGDEVQALILEVIEADRQLNRRKGGAAKAMVSKGSKAIRQFVLRTLIDELPPTRRQHLSSKGTLDRLEGLMRQHGYERVSRETLEKDVKAVRREWLRSPDTFV